MKLKLNQKLSVVFVLLLCLFGIVMYFTATNQTISLFSEEKLSSELNLGYNLFDVKYPGFWSVIDGKLYKGNGLIEGNFEVVDEIKSETGTLATIFMGDTRVSTNVTDEKGNRAIGTKAAQNVIDKVLKEGKMFSGKANVLGKTVHAKYMPLKDRDGNVIGMWFVGVSNEDIYKKIGSLQVSIGIASIILICLGIGVSYLLSSSITKSIVFAVENLGSGSTQITSVSERLLTSSQQLAEGNSELAASIEETSATLEQSSSMIKQNSENTKQAAQLSGKAKASAEKASSEMQDMMLAMDKIQKSSDQIAKIIKVIDEIAFQTNILALNAAVEAARAGDAGMGFAVVAEEVRNLAQRSAQAAKDTTAIIEGNIELSENGVAMVKKVAESLTDITEQAKKVNEIMDEIAAASDEQSQGISQINQAIQQMEGIVQQNASNGESGVLSVGELNTLTQKLKRVVHQLYTVVNGTSDDVLDTAASHMVLPEEPLYLDSNNS